VAATLDYTIAYESNKGVVDLCKIILGSDGSYYVTAPYHPNNKALAALWTVNYARAPTVVDFGEALDVAVLDDDNRRLKLAHHPDGFLQFSGEGVLSGRNADGSPKGLGTVSWPLVRPTFGPAFGLTFSDPHKCGRTSAGRRRTILFAEDEIEHLRKDLTGLRIAGFYFPVFWREYVTRVASDRYEVAIVNPGSQAVVRLRVALGAKDSAHPGFLGLQAMPHGIDFPDAECGFLLTSATGRLRRNVRGDLLGDQLVCMYPRPDENLPATPFLLNYPLPAPGYRKPRGRVLRLARSLLRRRLPP
jgi:hypothetical protein